MTSEYYPLVLIDIHKQYRNLKDCRLHDIVVAAS